MKRICYEIVDHGIEYSDYFPGCATAYTEFDSAVTGTGDTFHEALLDALDMIAQCEDEVSEKQLEAIFRTENIGGGPSVTTEVHVDISNSITPYKYKEFDCPHERGEFCEPCHDATVAEIENSLEDYPSYHVSIRYALTALGTSKST